MHAQPTIEKDLEASAPNEAGTSTSASRRPVFKVMLAGWGAAAALAGGIVLIKDALGTSDSAWGIAAALLLVAAVAMVLAFWRVKPSNSAGAVLATSIALVLLLSVICVTKFLMLSV